MRFACLLMTHLDVPLTKDTLESIEHHVTRDNLILVDGLFWSIFSSTHFTCPVIKGFNHGKSCSPYKNQLVGLQKLRKLYPNADWYVYVESDTLFTGEQFKIDLAKKNIWAAGFDVHEMNNPWTLLSHRLGIDIARHRIMIGCCQFYHRDFMIKLEEIDFFNTLIKLSAPYKETFPDYAHLAVEEGLLPSMCLHFGKTTLNLGCWDMEFNRKHYGIRFRPTWEMHEMVNNFSIVHPIKELEAIRAKYKKIRDFKNLAKGIQPDVPLFLPDSNGLQSL